MSSFLQFFPNGGSSGGSSGGGLSLDMLIVGGGGGSGGTAGNPCPGGNFILDCACVPPTWNQHQAISGPGGSGGVYEIFGYPVSPGGTYPITVGSGGAAGTGGQDGGTQGGNGGTSSFVDPAGETLQAIGGGGGGVAGVGAVCLSLCCAPALVADPTLMCGKPGGSGGGGAVQITNYCPNTPSPAACGRNCFSLGGFGMYQDDFITGVRSFPCTDYQVSGDTPRGKQTRYGRQRGNSTYIKCVGTCLIQYAGGVGYEHICGMCVAKNATQNTCAPDMCDQRGYCTGCKYPCTNSSVISAITGEQQCYGVTKCYPYVGCQTSCLITETAEPLLPAPCWSGCFQCHQYMTQPHPNDAGYGLGGHGVGGMTGPCCSPNTGSTMCWFSGSGYSGSSGSVTIRYPSSWGATPAPSRSGSVDCSPQTPGYYTYRWTSPGSITLP